MSDIVERLREIARRYEIIVLAPDDEKTLADHMREAADEIERLRSSKGEGWMPIESAPKGDGVILLGWGEYRERDGASPAFMRWYDSISGWSVNAMPFYPTHWQPLPSPPKAEGEK